MSGILGWAAAGLLLSAPVMAQTLPAIIHPDASSAASPVMPAPMIRRPGLAQVSRSNDGHFYVSASMNSSPVRMMVDTGASAVVLRAEDAAKAGLNPESLTYSIPASTANGRSYNAISRLHTLTIGGITQHDVPVMVGKPGALHISLLGQSFLAQLSNFRVSGNELVMQAE